MKMLRFEIKKVFSKTKNRITIIVLLVILIATSILTINRVEYCPICKNKTRTKIRKDTELINFPLFCPKCKQESVINVTKQKITVVEPDAKTQSR